VGTVPVSGCSQLDANRVSARVFEDTGLNSDNLIPPV